MRVCGMLPYGSSALGQGRQWHLMMLTTVYAYSGYYYSSVQWTRRMHQSGHSEQWPSHRLQWNTAIIYCHCCKLAGLL